MQPRTDLAMEAKALYERSAQEQTQLSGVAAREQERHGVRMTVVKITSAEGEQALGKPRGTYITAELEALSRREPGSFSNAVRTVSRALRELLGPCRQALVVGLGNRDITPDAIGPEAVKNLIVTRHLQTGPDEALPGLMRVAACQPGVLGQTGIESLELVKCAMQTAQPDVVIVIDALAAAEPGRLFRTVQLSDSGIVPGSGVGNSRQEFSRRTLGVPVIAVGVPTVVDAISCSGRRSWSWTCRGACWSRCRMWTHGCARWAGSSATAAIWRCTGDCRWVKFRLFCHKRSNYHYVNCIMSPPEQIAANRRVLITMWKCGKAIGVQKFFTLSTELSTPVFYELFLTNFGSQ